MGVPGCIWFARSMHLGPIVINAIPAPSGLGIGILQGDQIQQLRPHPLNLIDPYLKYNINTLLLAHEPSQHYLTLLYLI